MENNLQILKNINALYVEDDQITRLEYSKLFEKFFNTLHLASNPVEALEIFNHKSIQMIITDVKMPYMSGVEFAKEIRKIDKNIPIFLMSAFPEQNELIEAISLNLVCFLVKPLSYIKLKEALHLSVEKLIENNMINISINDESFYNPIEKKLHLRDTAYILPNKESLLLELLLKNRGRLVDRSAIEYYVYGDEIMSDAALKNLLLKLRNKLPNDSIITFKNSGYIFK